MKRSVQILLAAIAFVVAVFISCKEDEKTIAVTGVTLNMSQLPMSIGNSFTLIAIVEPANAANKNVRWESDNEAVAEVDANGKVFAKSEGTTIIFVITVDGEKMKRCDVTVSKVTEPVTEEPVTKEDELPVIRIETLNGASINSKENWTDMTSFVLIDQNQPKNNVSRTRLPRYDRIRGRGNSTWSAPKKPYRVRFRENVSFFGLPAAENWVLLAEYYDVSLIKNAFAFELGQRLGLQYTCTYHYVEFYLNGIYQGVYLLTEHRQADPLGVGAPGRVCIDPNKGWFVEIDSYWDDDPKFITANEKYKLPIMIKAPNAASDASNSNNPAYDYVKYDWNKLCDLMASANFPENDYRNMINSETFIKCFLVRIITNDGDWQIPRSNFFYKDREGKINAGPPWDFDFSFGASWHEVPRYKIGVGSPTTDAYPSSFPFFFRFFEDPVFLVKWKENWNDNHAAIFSMSQFIDDMANKIRKSAKENFKIWWLDYPVDFDYWIGVMKEYNNKRINFLDGEYNKVDVLPKNKIFTSQAFGYSEIVPQTFTLVAYGEMTNLSVMLQKGNSSDFEMTTEFNQTPTGNGGYLATVSVKPKVSLSRGLHSDVLILSGTNQRKNFSLELPLSFRVN
jgi:hypothetical protein